VFQYIYHIAARADWEQAQAKGSYTPPGFKTEGFVHCSTRDQLLGVANEVFAGRDDLVLLCIEPRRLTSPVCYENLSGRLPLFPHVYGPIDREAVELILDFPPVEDGTFEMPAMAGAKPQPS
jgi:uncharacterized protein (DUF952 family)